MIMVKGRLNDVISKYQNIFHIPKVKKTVLFPFKIWNILYCPSNLALLPWGAAAHILGTTALEGTDFFFYSLTLITTCAHLNNSERLQCQLRYYLLRLSVCLLRTLFCIQSCNISTSINLLLSKVINSFIISFVHSISCLDVIKCDWGQAI